MTRLSIYHEDGSSAAESTTDFDIISRKLNQHGVLLERWRTTQALAADADAEQVLAAYKEAVDQLSARHDFQSVDVVALRPDNPNKAEFRQKFLAEHRHADFEIRFFVDGQGLFYLHLDKKVLLVLCEKSDLISVPADTPHWFDMGENPNFTCIRFFTTEAGWEAEFTGSDIANNFPDFDRYVADNS